jgi:L-threonylcarbamoyladenylate synthase
MPSTAASFSSVIERGGVAVVGVDTVYGLCCDARNATAAARLAALKRRPPGKPAAVAFFALDAALRALPELGTRTRAAMLALLPGALTLLVANPAGRFPLAGGGNLLGIRVIDVEFDAGRPVLLTSANLAGGSDPRTLSEVPAQIRAGADLLVDRGPLPGTASTIVDLGALDTTGDWHIVRPGAFTQAALERALLGS